MAGDETDKGKLPGNHGQFGESDATEAYKPLEKVPDPKQPAAPGAEVAPDADVQGQTNAGERS